MRNEGEVFVGIKTTRLLCGWQLSKGEFLSELSGRHGLPIQTHCILACRHQTPSHNLWAPSRPNKCGMRCMTDLLGRTQHNVAIVSAGNAEHCAPYRVCFLLENLVKCSQYTRINDVLAWSVKRFSSPEKKWRGKGRLKDEEHSLCLLPLLV